MKSYRLSNTKYPKYTLAESALVLSELNPENKKASNGKPEIHKNKQRRKRKYDEVLTKPRRIQNKL